MENKVSIIKNMESTLASLSTGQTIKDSAKPTLQANYVALQEMRRNNPKQYENLVSAQNATTTMLTIATESLLGAVLNQDFWIVPYKSNMVEVKKGQYWKNLAMRFSVKPIKQINVVIFKQGDEIDLQGNPLQLVSYRPNLEVNGNKYENITGAFGEVVYTDDSVDSRYISKSEIDDLKAVSPSGNSEYSPWNKWAAKMVESKLLREIIVRNVSLDRAEMNKYCYNTLADDDRPLGVSNGELINIDDYPTKETATQKAINQVDDIVNQVNEPEEISEDDVAEYKEVFKKELYE